MPKVVKDGLIAGYDTQKYEHELSASHEATHSINAGQQNYNAKAYSTQSINAGQQNYNDKAHLTHSTNSGQQNYNAKAYSTHSINAGQQNYNANAYLTHSVNVPKVHISHTTSDGQRNYASSSHTNSDGQRNYAASSHTNSDGQRNYAASSHTNSDGQRNYAAKARSTMDSLILPDNSTLYFLEKDLIHPSGTGMTLHFLVHDEKVKFLPVQVAESIPFSSSKLPQIFRKFSVKPGSYYARLMDENIKLCEAHPVRGEVKSCKTSLEAMVDFAISNIGNKVEVRSTEINQETKTKYMVESAKKITNDVDNVVCHKLIYPYAIFCCHKIKKTHAYDVCVVDESGNKAKAVAVCHKHTSSWNLEHLSFQLLKVKPGSVPICHFLNENTIIWIPK